MRAIRQGLYEKYKRLIVFCLLAGAGGFGLLHMQHSAIATSLDWTSPGQLQIVSKTPTIQPVLPYSNGCSERTIKTRTKVAGIVQVTNIEVCVTEGLHISLAYSNSGSYVSYKGDASFYKLGSSYMYPLYLMPNSDRALFLPTFFTWFGVSLNVFDNISSRLTMDQNSLTYNLTNLQNRLYPRYDDDPTTTSDDKGAHDVFFSNNGRYLVYAWGGSYPVRDRYIRVDLSTGETKEFGRGLYVYEYSPLPAPQLAISNDGRHVIGSGIDQMRSWYINDTCAIPVPDYLDTSPVNVCPSREINAEDYGETIDSQSNARTLNIAFNDDATEANFVYKGAQSTYTRMVISPSNYIASPKLDYLALGDSYSSGEGDIEKRNGVTNYYMPLTDLGKDNCHMSSRSYPFLLRDYWGIDANNMHSVACSGARVVFDYAHPLVGYLGQGNRLASRSDIDVVQQTALEKFIPGRVPQLEFVKKYKPNIITLTGGGNDVGFVDMLSYCAYGSGDLDSKWKIVKEGFFGAFTCDYAKPDSLSQQLALKAIEDQYLYTDRLLKEIKKASPDSHTYLVGYPSFISEDPSATCTNSLELNAAERLTINYLTLYLNMQLKQAADDNGVNYVDIQHSLDGGRLCEGSEYMTGLWNINLFDESERSNLFHPNANAHHQIASTVNNNIGKDVQLDALNRPSSVGLISYQGSVLRLNIVSGDLDSNALIRVSLPDYTFTPGSSVTIELHSEPITIGTVTINEKGGFVGFVQPPSTLSVGFHLLTLTGTSYSGEETEVYQFVTVGLIEEADTMSLEMNINSQKPTSSRSGSTGKIQDTTIYSSTSKNVQVTQAGMSSTNKLTQDKSAKIQKATDTKPLVITSLCILALFAFGGIIYKYKHKGIDR